MNKYSILSDKINNEVFKTSTSYLKEVSIDKIFLPKEMYDLFYSETVGKGYRCTWFGYPVFECSGNEIRIVVTS